MLCFLFIEHEKTEADRDREEELLAEILNMVTMRSNIVDKMDVGITHPWGNDLWQPTFYLAQIVWECIGKVIVSARTVMDWLQQVSSNISKLNLPVMWMTPTGFLVQQMYPETKSRRITTYIDNTLINHK